MVMTKKMSTNQLKKKISEKSIQYLDMLFDLLPENSAEAEKILQIMEELVKEKKLNRHLLYRQMEKPLFFQDASGQDFIKRDPLIVKLVREGGIQLFNYYLKFKYGAPLSAELMTTHDIFVFDLAPIKNYSDTEKWQVFASEDDKLRIAEKYYPVYGMSYELLGEVFQEKNQSILQRLVECQFDFNQQSTIEHLKKYFYMNFDKPLQISQETLQFLLNHGLHPDSYLDVFLTGLWDEVSMQHTVSVQYPLINLINFLLDHSATLSHFSRDFIEKLQHKLELQIEKIMALPHSMEQQTTLEETWYLQGHLVEMLKSLEAAKAYYFKAGMRGMRAVQRKELVNLLKVVQSL